MEGNFHTALAVYNQISKIPLTNVTINVSFIQNVKLIILDQIVKKCATVLAKAATEQQECVTLDVILDGKDSFVTKVCL